MSRVFPAAARRGCCRRCRFLLADIQLVGRPVPDLCRHLGLTAGALSSSPTTAAPAGAAAALGGAGAGAGADGVGSRGRLADPSEIVGSSKKRNRGDGQARRGTPGVGASLSLPSTGSQVPAAEPVLPTPSAAGKDGAGAGRSGAAAAGTGRPAGRPVVLLPRQRIFYSSTFVRFVSHTG